MGLPRSVSERLHTLPALARLPTSVPHSLLNDALLGERLLEFILSAEKAAVDLMAGLLRVVDLPSLLSCKIFLFVLYIWQFYPIFTGLAPHFTQVSA